MFFHKKNVRGEDILDFIFSYSVGNYMNARYRYTLKSEGGVLRAGIVTPKVDEKETFYAEVPPDFAEKLAAMINENKVMKWDGFDKHNKYVLDGNSFSLYLTLKDKTGVTAHGYMVYPKHYKEFRSAADELFGGLQEE